MDGAAQHHRLGLDEPSRPERFLAAVTRIHAGRAARERLDDLAIHDEAVTSRLDAVERSAREDLEHIELTPEEEMEVVTRQDLFVERQSYQRLSDAGLLQPPAARTLLHEVGDHIEEVSAGHVDVEALGEAAPARGEVLVQRLTAHIPQPAGEDRVDIAYSEAMARRVAATCGGRRRPLRAHGRRAPPGSRRPRRHARARRADVRPSLRQPVSSPRREAGIDDGFMTLHADSCETSQLRRRA